VSVPDPDARQPVHTAMLAVLVATAAAIVLVAVGVRQTPDSAAFAAHIEYVTWATLAIGLVVVSVMGGVYCLPAWQDLHARSPWSARLASYGVAVLVTFCYDASPPVVFRLFLQGKSSALYLSLFREIGLGLLIAVSTLPALSGLVLAALLLSRAQPPWGKAGGRVAITELSRIRGELQRFLAVSALVIGGNVLAVAAFRGAMLAHEPKLPLQPVVLPVYGAMMTGLLALLYVPAYLGRARRRNFGMCCVRCRPMGGPTTTGTSVAPTSRRCST